MKKAKPSVTVLCGGAGEEREISLISGAEVAKALRGSYDVDFREEMEDQLPLDLNPKETVVFSVIHGTFGEDGKLQALLEERGFFYAGSEVASSRLCMDKVATKKKWIEAGLKVPKYLFFSSEKPNAEQVVVELGSQLVLKPSDGGSSIGVQELSGKEELRRALETLPSGNWLLEERIEGREMTIGLLDGKSMGCVEIIPKGILYDYVHKYTDGVTEYRAPAPLSASLEAMVKASAEKAYFVCGCRDFSRVDFFLKGQIPYFLEHNTIPGMRASSLFPKSAFCIGLSFEDLVLKMIKPAVRRFLADE